MFNSSFIEIEGFKIPVTDRFPYTDFSYKCLKCRGTIRRTATYYEGMCWYCYANTSMKLIFVDTRKEFDYTRASLVSNTGKFREVVALVGIRFSGNGLPLLQQIMFCNTILSEFKKRFFFVYYVLNFID